MSAVLKMIPRRKIKFLVSHEKFVVAFFGSANGMTDLELQYSLGICGERSRWARRDLQRLGLVKDSGISRQAKTRKAKVWTLTQDGLIKAKQIVKDLEG